MDRYKETFKTWNKVAKIYQDKFMDLDLYNDTYDYICNTIVKDKSKILEIGCGPGNITKYLLSMRNDFDIIGIDVAPNMVELAKKNNPTAKFEVLDVRYIDGIDSEFDGIVCGFCLPYLSPDDTAKLLQDCFGLLNKAGLLYLSFVEGDPSKSGYQIGRKGDRTYFYYYDLLELKRQVLDAQFDDIKIYKKEYKKSETESELHAVLIAQKK